MPIDTKLDPLTQAKLEALGPGRHFVLAVKPPIEYTDDGDPLPQVLVPEVLTKGQVEERMAALTLLREAFSVHAVDITEASMAWIGKILAPFLPLSQGLAIGEILTGEEGEGMEGILRDLATRISNMPMVYEQDGKGEEAIAYLHYFVGQCDWYITEKDVSEIQIQAFGLVSLGYEPELGYICIEEIKNLKVFPAPELDLHWTPKTLREIKVEKGWEL